MSDEQVLTKDIAEQFMVDVDSMYFNEFTTIEDAAAESLSKHQHVGICLSELPASAAQILRDAGHGHDGDE